MFVAHAWWSAAPGTPEDDGSLVLWGEDPQVRTAPAVRAGRRPKVRPHPFDVSADTLGEVLGTLVAVPPQGWVTRTADLVLPSFQHAPAGSPQLLDLRAGWASDRAEGESARLFPQAHWRVAAISVPAGQAHQLLTALAGEPDGAPVPGPDLQHLLALHRFAEDLIRRGRFLPVAIEAPDGHGVARWRPVLTGADGEWFRGAVATSPPAWGGEASPGHGAAAAVDALVDAGVRARIGSSGSGRRTGRGSRSGPRSSATKSSATKSSATKSSATKSSATKSSATKSGTEKSSAGKGALAWREALHGPYPAFAADSRQIQHLVTDLGAWQAEAVGGGAVRAGFRLVEPTDDDLDGILRPADQQLRPAAEAALWRLEFGLQDEDQPGMFFPAEQIWQAEATLVRLRRNAPRPQETLLAELGRALRLYPPLREALLRPDPAELALDTAGAHQFLSQAAGLLIGAGFVVQLPGWWSKPQRLGARLRAGTPAQPGRVEGNAVFRQNDLVQFDWRLSIGEQPLSDDEVETLIDASAPLVRLRGEWLQVDPEKLRKARAFLRKQHRSGPRTMSIADVLSVIGAGSEGPAGLEVTGVEATGWLADLLAPGDQRGLEKFTATASFTGTLRPYQERGVAWLAFLESLGLGAVLADDMGLGKTVQLLALIAADLDAGGGRGTGEQRPAAPTLLVCPMSLVGNWQREAARFTPGLRVHVQHGADRPSGKKFAAALAGADLVITTYALLARDALTLRRFDWRRVVLDEAQAVKNAATQAATAARSLHAARRIAVTGTPVENRLADLWSLMEFANPRVLGDPADFKKRYALPIERVGSEQAREQLRAVTQPFVLRRVKTDKTIIDDLPEKLEMEVVCTLTAEQAALYQNVVTDMLARIADAEGMQRRGLVLATMTKLKQVCNHPAQFQRDGSRVAGRSGKLARLEETLEEILASGEKALLFTQYAEFGEMLRTHLTARFGREVLFLHGAVPKTRRDEMVARFQEDTASGPPIFVLSLKAGGTGLTLTAANHVIHVDRWWNPAVEDQATDRAFRIGQSRTVQVRKFVCAGTLEERVATMIRDKRGLAASIVGTGEGWLTELSTGQLRELLTLDTSAVA